MINTWKKKKRKKISLHRFCTGSNAKLKANKNKVRVRSVKH